MRHRFVFLSAALIAVYGCGGGSSGPTFTRADADAIRQFVQNFATTYDENEAAKLNDFYSPSATFMPPNSSLVRGRESIEGYFTQRFFQGRATLEPGDVGGYGDLGYATFSYTLQVQPEGDDPLFRDRGKGVWLFKRLAGNWVTEWQIWNSDLPPRLPPAVDDEEDDDGETTAEGTASGS